MATETSPTSVSGRKRRQSSTPPNDGGRGSSEATLKFLVGRLVDGLSPRAIYLFGSRAWGRPRPDSDFDLLVVMDDCDEDVRDEYARVYQPVLGSGVGCDVVPISTADFAEVKEEPTSISYRAFREGRLLYEKR